MGGHIKPPPPIITKVNAECIQIVSHKGTPYSAKNAAYYQKGQNFFKNPCPIAAMGTW